MTNSNLILTATPNVIDVLSANPGLRLTTNQTTALLNNQLVLARPPGRVRGCISLLRYQDNDRDLSMIEVEKNGQKKTWDSSEIKNLGDFRERLQGAAESGHEVNFCINTGTKTMLMLNVYPCKCCTKTIKPGSSI